jgi:NAD(P)-dependent dehydrogenase (short-subunit alcohol dehydrogenase family)
MSPLSLRLKKNGVYLVTGGLGGVGLEIAEHLARTVQARLILIGRSPFPIREEWERWLATHDPLDSISSKIQKLRSMEDFGAEVLACSADVASREQMQEVMDQARARFGAVNGVIHCAGVADYAGIIQRRTRDMTENVMAPKVNGTFVLQNILQDVRLDFFVLFSAIGTILYKTKFGQVGYNAGNEFFDAFAQSRMFGVKARSSSPSTGATGEKWACLWRR